MAKPEKILYKNQDETCELLLAQTKKILEKTNGIEEAYIFGSVINGSGVGTYKEPWRDSCGQINTGSDVDVIVFIDEKNIPSSWVKLKKINSFQIYRIGRATVNNNQHIIEAHVPQSEQDKKNTYAFISEIQTLKII